MILRQNEGHIAVVWSGIAAPLIQEGDTYDYVVPKEGSNVWFDSMAVPGTARNKEGAYQFINFLLDARDNKQNTEWVGYATSNKATRNLLPNNIKNDYRFYPTQKEQKRLEAYKDLGKKTLGEYNKSFLSFKMSLK